MICDVIVLAPVTQLKQTTTGARTITSQFSRMISTHSLPWTWTARQPKLLIESIQKAMNGPRRPPLFICLRTDQGHQFCHLIFFKSSLTRIHPCHASQLYYQSLTMS